MNARNRARVFLCLTSCILLAFSCLAGQSSTPSLTYYLPQVANGQFAGGVIRTTFVLFNHGQQSASVTLSLTKDDGAPLLVEIPEVGSGSEFKLIVEPGGSKILQTSGAGSLTAGAATVRSSSQIGASAIFTIYDGAGNFVTEAGVAGSPEVIDFVIPVDTTGSFNTGLALLNFRSGNISLKVRLVDENGKLSATKSETLQARAHVAKFVTDFFPDAPKLRGTLLISSTGPVAALALRQNSVPLSFTTLPVVPTNSTFTRFELPQVADGGGIRTTFVLFNLSQKRIALKLSLRQDNGTPLEVSIPGLGQNNTFNLELEPGASKFLQTSGTNPLPVAGAAIIISETPVGVSAIFSLFDSQGGFLTETGVGASPILKEFTLPVDITGSGSTGLAVFNSSAVPVTLKLDLRDSNGAVKNTLSSFPLPAGNHVAKFVAEFFSGIGTFRGSLSVSASAPVSAVTLRQNASPLSFTTLPIAFSAELPTITSLKATSARPLEVLEVSGSGFAPSAGSVVRFFDDKGYYAESAILDSSATLASTLVPLSFDAQTGQPIARRVNVQVIRNLPDLSLVSNVIQGFAIEVLPALTQPIGTIAGNFFGLLELYAKDVQDRLALNEKQSSGGLATTTIGTNLQSVSSRYAALNTKVKAIMENPSQSFSLGQFSGNALSLDSKSLEALDKMLATVSLSIVKNFAASQASSVTGAQSSVAGDGTANSTISDNPVSQNKHVVLVSKDCSVLFQEFWNGIREKPNFQNEAADHQSRLVRLCADDLRELSKQTAAGGVVMGGIALAGGVVTPPAALAATLAAVLGGTALVFNAGAAGLDCTAVSLKSGSEAVKRCQMDAALKLVADKVVDSILSETGTSGELVGLIQGLSSASESSRKYPALVTTYLQSNPPPPKPVIAVNKTSIPFTSVIGKPNPAAASFTVTNIGPAGSFLIFSIAPSDGRLSLNSANGTLESGASKSHTVQFNVAGTTQPETKNLTLTIQDSDSKVQKATISVQLKVEFGNTAPTISLRHVAVGGRRLDAVADYADADGDAVSIQVNGSAFCIFNNPSGNRQSGTATSGSSVKVPNGSGGSVSFSGFFISDQQLADGRAAGDTSVTLVQTSSVQVTDSRANKSAIVERTDRLTLAIQ